MNHTCCEPKSKEEDELIGTLTCPKCGHKQKMQIPTNQCIPMYKCNKCKKIIRATKKCCVFCDYGDRPCPVGAHK